MPTSTKLRTLLTLTQYTKIYSPYLWTTLNEFYRIHLNQTHEVSFATASKLALLYGIVMQSPHSLLKDYPFNVEQYIEAWNYWDKPITISTTPGSLIVQAHWNGPFKCTVATKLTGTPEVKEFIRRLFFTKYRVKVKLEGTYSKFMSDLFQE